MISVSYLKSMYSKEETLAKIMASEADFLHVDLMDNTYVPYTNFTLNELLLDLKDSKKPLDVHLMVDNPLKYLPYLLKLNVKIITVHLNIKDNLGKIISLVKKSNVLMGLAINPSEDVHLLDPYLDKIDYVLVMGVNPGMGGQPFKMNAINNLKYLQDKNILLGLDGGVNGEVLKYLEGLKIANLVSGSYVCMHPVFDEKIRELKKYFSKNN